MDVVTDPVPSRRRQARLARRRQAATWGSWPGDSGDYWLTYCTTHGDSSRHCRGKSKAGRGEASEKMPRGHRDHLSRSRSEQERLGAATQGGLSAGNTNVPVPTRQQQEPQLARQLSGEGLSSAATACRRLSIPWAAETLAQRLLRYLLVWGSAVAACALLWVQWGAYLGRQEKQAWSAVAGAGAVLAVPLSYTLGGALRFPRAWQAWQPFQGGPSFVLLQAAAWFFWAWALAPFVMPLGAECPSKACGSQGRTHMVPDLPTVHLAFSALACALAQLATSTSLHVYIPHSPIWPPQLRSPPPRHRRVRGSLEASAAALWARSRRCYRALMSINISLATLLCAVAAVCDIWFHGPPLSRLPSSKHVLVAVAGFASLAVIGPSTYGLGGSLRYRHTWSFWQPFMGGLSFVVIQALAWAMFAAALAAFLLAAYCATALTSSRLGNGLLASAGFGGLASEVLMAASLLCYVAPQPGKKLKGSTGKLMLLDTVFEQEMSAASPVAQTPVTVTSDKKLGTETAVIKLSDGTTMAVEAPIDALTGALHSPYGDHVEAIALPAHWLAQQALNKSSPPRPLALAAQSVWGQVKVWAVLALFYCNHLFSIAVISLSLLLGWRYLAGLALAVLLYLPTYRGSPHMTGRRTWNAARDKLAAVLEEVAIRHWGGLRLVRTSKAPLDASQSYVFGYHPHGLFPVTAAWFQYTSAWRQLFPGIRPVSLAATAIFMAPLLRDLMLWAGNREVSRRGFQNALDQERAVVICPGGQSELCLHQPRDRRKFVLCARKKGFIRLAMQNGATLVPVFCFGESFNMHNLFDWPAIQRWTYRKIGFPVPFLPVGLWGVLPVPKKGAVSIVVGEPIAMRPAQAEAALAKHGGATPSEEEVEAMRVRYFQALADLFHAHKAKHGYADFQLELRQN